ncbi:MAG: ABC transporter permease [Coriobacteriales bacterium]|jgi:hypothetical protein|nr:ABC transporter permease [Coriobacteriales bacterium]
MTNTFTYTLLALVRERDALIWALAFPLVLATLFFAMFSGIDSSYRLKTVPIVVVDDAHYRDAAAFVSLMRVLSEPAETGAPTSTGAAAHDGAHGPSTDAGPLLDVRLVASTEEADALLKSRDVVGYYVVDASGTPRLVVSAVGLDITEEVTRTILKTVIDNYLRSAATAETVMAKTAQGIGAAPAWPAGAAGPAGPAAPAGPAGAAAPAAPAAAAAATIAELSETLAHPLQFTKELRVTANDASGSVRYYYALLGFAALMTAQVGMLTVVRTQANLSPLGARRALGGTNRSVTLVAGLLASWLLSFVCILIAYCYIRFALGVSFGGRDPACVLGLAAATLMATSFGTLIGAIPRMTLGAKGGILIGITCLASLFAGLYGTPAQRLSDWLSREAPAFQQINPVQQVSTLFYTLYYYDGYEAFFSTVGALLVFSAACLALAAVLMGRQRYASV